MYERGKALLEKGTSESPEWKRFTLLTAMLGAKALGNSEAAGVLWSTHAHALAGEGVAPYAAYILGWGGPATRRESGLRIR